VHIDFYFPIPATRMKKKDELVNKPHTHKPDTDNLIKFYLDCANEILYEDDSQVYKIIATKQYCTTPRTELKIIEVE